MQPIQGPYTRTQLGELTGLSGLLLTRYIMRERLMGRLICDRMLINPLKNNRRRNMYSIIATTQQLPL